MRVGGDNFDLNASEVCIRTRETNPQFLKRFDGLVKMIWRIAVSNSRLVSRTGSIRMAASRHF